MRLKFPWVGVVNRSQADINKNVDMIAARRREREYFNSTPEYKHLAHRMGSEHLAKMLSKVGKSKFLPFFFFFFFPCKNKTVFLKYFYCCWSSLYHDLIKWLIFQHLETVIKSRIPGIQSLINKTVSELETELSRLGKPIATDAGVSLILTSFKPSHLADPQFWTV